MRLPTKQEDGKSAIDKPEAIKLIRATIDGGVNYVDTAYGYHDGNSELVTGEALKDGYRDKVSLATKLPSWLVHKEEDMDRLLNEQLKKLQVEHIDFYLLHALNKAHIDNYRKLGYQKFLERAKADGRIGRACFSFHDDAETFLDILNDYDWAMAQVQFNYLDDENQATLEGIRAAGRKGVGIVVMEPLRGGALANPPDGIRAMIEEREPKRSPVEWAFDYVAQFPEVKVILSGISTLEQARDNLGIFSRLPETLSAADQAFVAELKRAYLARTKIGCTGCRYCVPCPQGVAIPDIFRPFDDAYRVNSMGSFEWGYKDKIDKGIDASKCVACGACEAACPQNIAIIDNLAMIRDKYN
jgi:predicted aldo/keto reductase-like oxidoreductase